LNTVFQISALPRSGTAFLSALFNLHPGCICFHELPATDRGWKDTRARARAHWPVVGESGTYSWTPKAIIPESRKVYIRRDWRESRRRFNRAARWSPSEPDYEALAAAVEAWARDHGALIIPFAAPFPLETLERIWTHCLGSDCPFPAEKAAMLAGMNIQRANPAQMFAKHVMTGRKEEFFEWVS
jgi:hypothetical protein